VDLLEIGRVSGEAAIFKCGAAPTYLLRRGEVTRFSSRTAPVGILESLDAERISFTVEPGDVLVQVSDGFTGGEEDCPWLAELLLAHFEGDAEAFARMAISRAAAKHADDLSIIVTTVSAVKAETEAHVA
jgi:stage II sporulation protein E